MPLSAQWRRAGLFGADVRALVADPADPDLLYLGTSGGEVYVSTDGAKSWTNARNGVPFPGYVVDSLVIDRNHRLWAACWGLWGGSVIAVSDDHGKTWMRRDNGLQDLSVRAIAVDPTDAGFLVVGGLTGVYRSVDDGGAWEKISDQENVESVAIDPRTHDRIYIGTWRQGWRTDDAGKTWARINNGMVLDTDMFGITVDPKNPDNIWIATCGWVYNTINRGDLWTRYRDGFDNRRIHDVKIDPCDDDTVYAGSVAGLYRSEDRGKSWYLVSSEDLVVNSIVVHPGRPDRLLLGVEGDGVYVSHDHGKSFTRASEGLHNLRITSIVADPAKKDTVYAAVAFGGAASGVYRSDDAGRNWTKVSATQLPEILSLSIAPEREAQPRYLAGTEKGFFFSNDAQQWTQAEPSYFPIRVNKVLRFNRTRYFAATSEGVFTSRDGGQKWYRLAGADSRTVDITLGNLGSSRALFALTNTGITVFDGEKWTTVANTPATGRTIGVRTINGVQHVFVAGAQGVKAGRISMDGQWIPSEAPDAQYAAVYAGSDDLLFLTSRQQREILIGTPADADWLQITLPAQNTEVTAIATDPFANRYYVGTVGEGVFIYDGKTEKYVRHDEPAIAATAAAGKRTHTLGQVVHNEGVIAQLQAQGIETVDTLDDVL
ncbi:MAG TPA: hypothetical protein VLU46_17475, partial [Thermoanaerobaculia bacterium]|nr:hypothetical protein [Thermoanaerobaculia bacterium]